MAQGTVSYFDKQGKYGFIDTEADDSTDQGEVFFHMDDVEGPDLTKGQDVDIEIKETDKGARASTLTRLDDDGEPVELEQESTRDDNILVDDDGNRWVSINDM